MKLIKKYLNPSGPIYSTIALPEVEVRPGYPRLPKESDYMSDELLAEAFATPQEYLDAASLRYLLNLYHTDYGKFKQEWERLHPGSTAEGRQAIKDLKDLSTMMQHRNLAMDKWKLPLGVLMGGAVAAPLAGTASALGTAFTEAYPVLSGALKGAGHLFFGKTAYDHLTSGEGFAKTKLKFQENPTNFFGNLKAWSPITNGNFSTEGGLFDPNADRGWAGSLLGDLGDLLVVAPTVSAFNKANRLVSSQRTKALLNLNISDDLPLQVASLNRKGNNRIYTSTTNLPNGSSLEGLFLIKDKGIYDPNNHQFFALSKEDMDLATTESGMLRLMNALSMQIKNRIDKLFPANYEMPENLVLAANDRRFILNTPGASESNPLIIPERFKGNTHYIKNRNEPGGTFLSDGTYRDLDITPDIMSPDEYALAISDGKRVMLQVKGMPKDAQVSYGIAKGNYGVPPQYSDYASLYASGDDPLRRFLVVADPREILDFTKMPAQESLIFHNGITGGLRLGGYLNVSPNLYQRLSGTPYMAWLNRHDPNALNLLRTSKKLLPPELLARLDMYRKGYEAHVDFPALSLIAATVNKRTFPDLDRYKVLMGFDHGGSDLTGWFPTDIVTNSARVSREIPGIPNTRSKIFE